MKLWIGSNFEHHATIFLTKSCRIYLLLNSFLFEGFPNLIVILQTTVVSSQWTITQIRIIHNNNSETWGEKGRRERNEPPFVTLLNTWFHRLKLFKGLSCSQVNNHCCVYSFQVQIPFLCFIFLDKQEKKTFFPNLKTGPPNKARIFLKDNFFLCNLKMNVEYNNNDKVSVQAPVINPGPGGYCLYVLKCINLPITSWPGWHTGTSQVAALNFMPG